MIPRRKPGRPKVRTEPYERSSIVLPVSLLLAIDMAKGTDSRRQFIEEAVREKLVIDQKKLSS